MKPGGRDPEATTERIRDAAVDELLAVGQAVFAMEGVAKRAFFSIGTVYNRWPDRESLLADIARERIAPSIDRGLGSVGTHESAIDWVLGAGQEAMLLAGESILAGHTMPEVAPASLDTWRSLHMGLGQHLPPSMTWYVATYAIGNALLEAIGCSGPQPPTGRVRWLADAGASAQGSAWGERVRIDGVEVPMVPAPRAGDDVAQALIEAAQVLLAEQGASGTSTRDIAASAGVTTGSLYRRYGGKSELLADVMLAQLQPDRYAWTWELVRALAGADPLTGAAGVLADRMITTAQDAPAQRVLLQVGIAARNDPVLRAQVSERIQAAHRARVAMVERFAEAGLLREDVIPEVLAWGFQTIPVGVRALLPLGVPLHPDPVRESMEALLRAAAPPSP